PAPQCFIALMGKLSAPNGPVHDASAVRAAPNDPEPNDSRDARAPNGRQPTRDRGLDNPSNPGPRRIRREAGGRSQREPAAVQSRCRRPPRRVQSTGRGPPRQPCINQVIAPYEKLSFNTPSLMSFGHKAAKLIA